MVSSRARIDVGILGATGTVGQQFIRHPEGQSLVSARPGWRRASARKDGAMPMPRRGACPTSCRRMSVALVVQACAPRGAAADLLGARCGHCARGRTRLRRGGPHRRQQREQLPDGGGRPAADPRNQRRPPLADRPPAPGARLVRRHRDEPELLDGGARDGAGAAAAIRSSNDGRGDDACRRCPGQAILACRRSTFSATSFPTSTRKKPRSNRRPARSSARARMDASPIIPLSWPRIRRACRSSTVTR